ncbi:uncharacterized protein LOC128953245 [Oppia nitens]|uniref:uncharacterized protein LOC128953245 n=1 Tax=Oppia nitens TaxID=1686743 RepID=UPI0023DA8F78|nr:uncharacterized protein LOC128953245 [Oppia nitens]
MKLLLILGFVGVICCATLVKRDIKDDLLKKAVELEAKAAEEVKKLEAEGRKHEAEMLSREANVLKRVADELEKATDQKQIEHLERELQFIEHRLDEIIKHDERTHPPHPTHPTAPPTTSAPQIDKRDIKAELLKRAQELEVKAEAEAKKLEAKGEHREAQQLRHELAELKRLAHELEVGTDVRVIEHLEVRLLELENHIEDIIRRDEQTRPPHPTHPPKPTDTPAPTGSSYIQKHNDIKDDLLKRAADVEKLATDEIKKLESDGRKHEAQLLSHEVEAVKLVAKRLAEAKEQHEIDRLEVELLVIENRVIELIKRDERTPKPHPTKPAPSTTKAY